MLSDKFKRCLSFAIALVLILSGVPVYAAEWEDTTSDQSQGETLDVDAQLSAVTASSKEALTRLQAAIDDIMTRYLGATKLSDEVIIAKVAEMDWETYQTARGDISELEASGDLQVMTEADLEQLSDDNASFFVFSDALEEKAAADKTVTTLATTVTVLDGQVSLTDTATNMSESGGTVTIKASGGYFSQTTNTVTITNKTSNKAKLTFSYSASNYSSFSQSSASGTFEAVLEADGSSTISIKGKKAWSDNTATLILSNFTLTAMADSSDITFQYDSSLGSITVGGAATSNGAVVNVSGETGAALVATPASNAKFLGWINADDGTLLSSSASYTLMPAAAMTVKAVFAKDGGTVWYGVGGMVEASSGTGFLGTSKLYYHKVSGFAYLFDDLNTAAAKAAATTYKAVVLLNSGTLTAGTHTIPAGVTFVIPFDAENTVYKADVVNTKDAAYVKPKTYRILTMASGAALQVSGDLCLPAQQKCGQGSNVYGGSPVSSVGFVQMEAGSSITVNSGGGLYAYGFITGSGTVTIKSGAQVHELFQFTDCRGGTQTTGMENGVFPFNQYYVQNIEVPMTLETGASETTHAAIYMGGSDFSFAVEFIGSGNSLFKMTDGEIVKRYDGSTDRLMLSTDGTVSLSPIELTVSTTTIKSENYDFPLASNITVTLETGCQAQINQDMCLLPGAQVIFEDDTTCTINSNIYAYDADQWGTYAYAGSNVRFKALSYAPGRSYTRTEADLVDAKIVVMGDITCGEKGFIYTTTGGADICGDITASGSVTVTPGTQTVTYQLIQGSGEGQGYQTIAITPAKLKNVDGSFTLTENCATTNTYTYIDGFWRCETHSWDWAQGVCTVCDEKAIQCNGIKLEVRSEIQLLLKFTVHEDTLTQYPTLAAFVSEEKNEVAENGAWDPIAVSTLAQDDSGKYVITCGIAAGEMTGLVTVEFKADGSDTAAVIPVYDKYQDKMVDKVEKNVVSFAEAALAAEGESGKNVALCNGALTFGGYAQLFYGTHTGKLAYEFLNTKKVENFAPSLAGADDALATVTPTKFSGDNGVKASTQKLNLDSEIYIRTYFTLAATKTAENYTVTVSGPDNNGEGTFTNTVAFEYDEASKRWYVDILNVPPAYWDDTYTITITDTSMTENNTYTVTTSVLAWCARCVNAQNASVEQKNMARAMYFYNLAADTYFGTGSGT